MYYYVTCHCVLLLTFVFYAHVGFRANCAKINIKIRVYYQLQKLTQRLISGDIRFMRIFAGILRDGRQTIIG